MNSLAAPAAAHYRSTVPDAQPYAYWRLNRGSSRSTAVDEVSANLRVENGAFTTVSPSASSWFNGEGSLQLPNNRVAQATYLSVQMSFQTTVNSLAGVLTSTGHRFADRSRTRHTAVHELLAAGHSQRAIARQWGMGGKPAARYARALTPEELFTGQWQNRPTKLDGFKTYLHERWTSGSTNVTPLWKKIAAQDCTGGRGAVSAYLRPRCQSHNSRTAAFGSRCHDQSPLPQPIYRTSGAFGG
ncbi:hypothetical protein ACFORO_19880 [Amycolatopsis halotolerans]|uniref:Uncharacterized protein n=1 Tax=Amycolatopsis halotolerans TaxID=330083 RepID=A0ABV7QGJ5_9PSEU